MEVWCDANNILEDCPEEEEEEEEERMGVGRWKKKHTHKKSGVARPRSQHPPCGSSPLTGAADSGAHRTK
jgi:hypothetical protein